MAMVLGLDMGSNSLGWALVDPEKNTLIDMGVRIFQAGVDNLNGAKEESRGVSRRLKRGMRRQYRRTRQRKKALRLFLIMNNLLPNDANEFDVLLMTDPYPLRKMGLDEKLTLLELGRVIDHINSRRGFRSNRKASSDEEDTGVIFEGDKTGTKPGINEIEDALDSRLRSMKAYRIIEPEIELSGLQDLDGFRTAGEYLASLDPVVRRRRCRFTLREHFEIEVQILFKKQQQFYPKLLTDEMLTQLNKLIFWQRPLQSSRKLVGNCTFEPGKKRSHKSHPDYQRFRMLQQLNMFTIRGSGRIKDDEAVLMEGERSALYNHLITKGKLKEIQDKSTAVIKLLKLDKNLTWGFGLNQLDAPYTELAMKSALGPDLFVTLCKDEIHDIWNVLNFAVDKDWVIQWMIKQYQLTEDQAKAVAKIKLEDGYGSVSLRAARKILPFLEQGLLYHEACEKAGFKHSQPQTDIPVTNRIPALAPEDARNPIVQTSFAEMRRVVNLLIKTYGPIDTIRIEMGRDVKQPKNERLKSDKINRENKAKNDEVREMLRSEFGLHNPSKNDIQKYKLWDSQNHKCIYTGVNISQDDLFNAPIDVDHVIPYSKSLDDGMANKVVCLRDINAKKGDRTPLEAIQAGLLNEHELRERLEGLVRANKMNPRKARRFFLSKEEVAELVGDDFHIRQLNDTRYVARLTHKYVRHVCSDISISTGVLTSMLRHKWGLSGIIPELAEQGLAWIDAEAVANSQKSRADHRHHAIDALVVALTTRSIVKQFADLNKSNELHNLDKHIGSGRISIPLEPIPGLRALALERTKNILVSHRVNRKVRGQLHEETIYGLHKDYNGVHIANANGMPLYAVRKPIESLSPGDVLSIIDGGIRRAVANRLLELGEDIDNPKFTVPKTAFLTPLFLPKKDGSKGPHIKSVRIARPSTGMVRIREHGAYAETGSNDHITLGPFNEKRKREYFNVKTLFEASSAMKGKQTNTEAMTFRTNEMYVQELDNGEGNSAQFYRVQKINKADGQICFRHHSASGLIDNNSRLLKTPNTATGAKVAIDALGRLLNS
ncbi:MAG: type II CRISPR RNA-guided endonuclease Cas9 [Ignavibacteria bacterium]|nr:type II CRISPR RNA-guided endonuclease Cas9 [Ignavibacteria bacterium]